MHMILTPMQDPSISLPRVGIQHFAVSAAFPSVDYVVEIDAG